MLKFLAVFAAFLAFAQASMPTSGQAAGNPVQAPAKIKSQQTAPSFPTISSDKTPPTEHSVTVTKFPPVSISRDWIDWGVWVFSGLLVVVGFLQVWLLWRTLGAIERQATMMDIAQTIAINKERPRLSIEIKDFVLGEVPVINYELTCHGTTPAYVQSSWEMTSLTPIPDLPWPKSQYGFPLRDLPEVISTGTIKGYVFIMGTDNCGYDTEDSQKEALGKGELHLLFRVRIVFKDIFDDEREHEYLFSKVYGLNRRKSDSGSPAEMLGVLYGTGFPGWGDSTYKYGQDE